MLHTFRSPGSIDCSSSETQSRSQIDGELMIYTSLRVQVPKTNWARRASILGSVIIVSGTWTPNICRIIGPKPLRGAQKAIAFHAFRGPVRTRGYGSG